MRRLPLAAGLALSAPLFAGCSTVALTGSRLEAVPAGARTRAHATAAVLDLDGLRVLLLTGDTTPVGQPLASLRVRIVVRANEAGTTFDPDGLRLRTVDGGEWRVRAWKAGRFESGTCSVPEPEAGHTPPAESGTDQADAGDVSAGPGAAILPLVRGTCVDLGFARTLRLNERAELWLDGFARDARPLQPVAVSVTRREWRGVERVYWLEPLAVAGYVLAPR